MIDFDWMKSCETSRITDPMQHAYYKWQMVVCKDIDTAAIGNNGKLLWDLPLERKLYLHDLVAGTTIVTGRKTFDSLPRSFLEAHPIVVVTRDEFFINKRDQFVDGYGNNVEEVQAVCDRIGKKVSVIGGANIYEMFWPVVDRLHVSSVHNPDGLLDDADSFFPYGSKENRQKNGNTAIGLCYMIYKSIVDNGLRVDHSRCDFLKMKAGLI